MSETKILILYYSMYGNTFRMAEEVSQGVKEDKGVISEIKKVPELIPDSIIQSNETMKKAREMQKDIPVATLDDLRNCDGLILGTPTRFGNMCSQMRNFLDQTGKLWQEGSLIGKPAGVFTSTATFHGGQETTLISMILTLLHHGMLVVGIPYNITELSSTNTGGTPYGASHVVGENTYQQLSQDEKVLCRALGKRVADIAVKLKHTTEAI